MMRILSFIFVITLALGVSAQQISVKQTFDQGTKLAQNRQYEKALELYRKAAFEAENEKTPVALLAKTHFNIGVCLYQLKRSNESVLELSKAIELSGGKYQKAFYALGMAQTDLGNWSESENAFRKALKISGEDGEAWFDLALVYWQEKNLEAAQNAFQNSIKFNSRNAADAYNNLGVIAALKNDWSLAETDFETALQKSNGESTEAQNNLRLCQIYRQNVNANLTAELTFSQLPIGR